MRRHVGTKKARRGQLLANGRERQLNFCQRERREGQIRTKTSQRSAFRDDDVHVQYPKLRELPISKPQWNATGQIDLDGKFDLDISLQQVRRAQRFGKEEDYPATGTQKPRIHSDRKVERSCLRHRTRQESGRLHQTVLRKACFRKLRSRERLNSQPYAGALGAKGRR